MEPKPNLFLHLPPEDKTSRIWFDLLCAIIDLPFNLKVEPNNGDIHARAKMGSTLTLFQRKRNDKGLHFFKSPWQEGKVEWPLNPRTRNSFDEVVVCLFRLAKMFWFELYNIGEADFRMTCLRDESPFCFTVISMKYRAERNSLRRPLCKACSAKLNTVLKENDSYKFQTLALELNKLSKEYRKGRRNVLFFDHVFVHRLERRIRNNSNQLDVFST